ncbi:protein downstream neighbor of son homolog [Tubulanus polymorphus]|uniref:protein downstream neighbor of son homolog n=1 Tax=Tubulanus polymorphus TaxID=672921 RepID=UPI003DA1FECB
MINYDQASKTSPCMKSPKPCMKSPSPSPKWKRPADIMKLIRKRRSLSYSGQQTNKNESSPNNPTTKHDRRSTSSFSPGGGIKRKVNPFLCSPRKRLKSANLNDKSTNLQDFEDSDFQLFRMLDSDKRKQDNITEESVLPKLDELEKSHSPEKIEDNTVEESPVIQGKWIFPVDWSLKMKLRFLSDSTFNWSQSLKTLDEAAGICAAVRCQTLNQDCGANDKVRFKKLCSYWQHPNIPWLKLYPRIVPDLRVGKHVPGLLEKMVEESLYNNWVTSFTSVFHLLKAKYCPYFYMCTHQFTVMFRAAGIGSRSINAVITPTTKGIREALQNEDVEFTMPLRQKENQPQSSESESSDTDKQTISKNEEDGCEDDDDEDDAFTTDEGASSWLQEMGLNNRDFPELNPTKIKLQREGFKQIDSRPESLVYVEGGHTQALFNYLLNCRSCIATTGVQAGIPPTLLSPVAFTGATLKSLQTKTSMVQQEGVVGKKHMLEVVGPILPHIVHNICELVSNLHTEYTVSLSTHDPSTPLNVRASTKDPTSEFINTFGFSEATSDFLKQNQELNKAALREIAYEAGLYKWVL